MEYWHLFVYLFFGVLPSLVWLAYYLAKDLHPEPKRMILKVFFYGALVTIPVFFIQLGLSWILKASSLASSAPLLASVLRWFLVIAFVEELSKYLVVRLSVLNSRELDEPLDIMLYMVVAALGFAATENTIYLFSPAGGLSLGVVLQATALRSFIRFIGATFLHTLCSALLGYFLALASIKNRRQFWLTASGMVSAALLHGLYNFSIITLAAPYNVVIPVAVVFLLAGFMMYDFDSVKKIKGICKL